MFTAALFTLANRWKEAKRSSADKWINKTWYIHTARHYSALKRKEILTHATTWMNLEDIMPSEILSKRTKPASNYTSNPISKYTIRLLEPKQHGTGPKTDT